MAIAVRLARYRSVCVPVSDAASMLSALTLLQPVTVVVDVEPLILAWGSDSALFPEAASNFVHLISTGSPQVRNIIFATNSARWIQAPPAKSILHTSVVVGARKPVHMSYLRRCGSPIVVIGDQLLTDGLLAVRAGGSFVHWQGTTIMPWWPRAQTIMGRLIQPIFFTRTDWHG